MRCHGTKTFRFRWSIGRFAVSHHAGAGRAECQQESSAWFPGERNLSCFQTALNGIHVNLQELSFLTTAGSSTLKAFSRF